jgi:hypothetical protein
MVAVWPGMGNVALLAGSYLVSKLEARLLTELPAADLFDVQHVEVRDGVAKIGALPRNLIFLHRDPGGRHDLVIFIGEAQPPVRGYGLCQRLLDAATRLGVKRVFTFAAMSTQVHPGTEPRVFGVVSEKRLIGEIEPLEIDVLQEGQISGMNGLLLAAAAERDVEAMCLMGEMPYFATAIPNPKAAQAVLETFSILAGVQIDFGDLEEQASAIDQQLVRILDRLGGGEGEGDEDEEDEATFEAEASDDVSAPPPGGKKKEDDEPALDLHARERIEHMFELARRDRSKAMELKNELDRLGVFRSYENRFLDLFRKGE